LNRPKQNCIRKGAGIELVCHGECDIAADGAEALETFRRADEEGKRCEIVCPDVMMPAMNAQTVVKEIRRMEEAEWFRGPDGVKIIMTTALSDPKNILQTFKSQCEAHLVKPIAKKKILEQIRLLGLLP
jgi:two-component system chemotaxis response regulator CheY